MSDQSSSPSNGKPHPLKGKSPWDGISKAERARRIAKMVNSARANRKRSAAASGVANGNGSAASPGRRVFTPAQREQLIGQIQALTAGGALLQDACAKYGILSSVYHAWLHRNDRLRSTALIRRPPPEEREVQEMPAPRVNGHARQPELSRIERIAALIVAVEKLL